MNSIRTLISWFLGFICIVACLTTAWNLIYFISYSALFRVDKNVPCCGHFWKPLLWNFGLLTLFVIQHSGMATATWKSAVSHVGVDSALERMIYVISSCTILHLIFNYFAVLPGPHVWYFVAPGPPLWFFDLIDHPFLWWAAVIVHVVMWFAIIAGIFVAEPLELVGLRQIYAGNEPPEGSTVAEPLHRKIVPQRHIGMLAFLILLWVTMDMSVERFLLALFWTLYILLSSRMQPSDYVVVKENSTSVWNYTKHDSVLAE